MGTRKNMEEDEILFIKDKNDSYYRVIVPDYIPHLYKGEDDGKTFEHGYLIVFTPAYILEKQYLTFKNVLLLLLAFLSICFLGGLLWG